MQPHQRYHCGSQALGGPPRVFLGRAALEQNSALNGHLGHATLATTAAAYEQGQQQQQVREQLYIYLTISTRRYRVNPSRAPRSLWPRHACHRHGRP